MGHHHASSCIILHHLASSCIILHHLASSGIILDHLGSSWIILHHLASSCIILHHLASSCIILHHLASSSSSSSSSSSTSAGASAPPSSSSSGDSGSPAFLPGRSPNHLGNLVFGLFCHSEYFSFHKAWRCSALTTSQPPSYNFRLSSYVLVSVLRSYLEYMRIFGGYLPVRASGSKPFFMAFCLSCCFCLSLSSLRS